MLGIDPFFYTKSIHIRPSKTRLFFEVSRCLHCIPILMLTWQADQILSYPSKGLSSFTLAKQSTLSGKWGTISTMLKSFSISTFREIGQTQTSSIFPPALPCALGCCHNGSARAQACLSQATPCAASLWWIPPKLHWRLLLAGLWGPCFDILHDTKFNLTQGPLFDIGPKSTGQSAFLPFPSVNRYAMELYPIFHYILTHPYTMGSPKLCLLV